MFDSMKSFNRINEITNIKLETWGFFDTGDEAPDFLAPKLAAKVIDYHQRAASTTDKFYRKWQWVMCDSDLRALIREEEAWKQGLQAERFALMGEVNRALKGIEREKSQLLRELRVANPGLWRTLRP